MGGTQREFPETLKAQSLAAEYDFHLLPCFLIQHCPFTYGCGCGCLSCRSRRHPSLRPRNRIEKKKKKTP